MKFEEEFEKYLDKLHCSHTNFDEVAKSAYLARKELKESKQKVKEAIHKIFPDKNILINVDWNVLQAKRLLLKELELDDD